ncbi:MAG: 30S ribosome-binding factor RbfA [Bryobacteraceae bacterium]|nr:30S ribosome-binding factor RbfA [Bryobacteraceae bacterium]
MDELRTRRVSETMREELSELIRFESSDPRLTDVEVTDVVLSSDARRADILVRLPQDAALRTQALEGLEHARVYLRHQLAQRIELFRAPDLRFVPDSQVSGGQNLAKLRRRLRRGRPKD